MAISLEPLVDLNAEQHRNLNAGLLTDEGIINGTGLAVTVGANMTVNVSAGKAWIKGDDNAEQGYYWFSSTATENRGAGNGHGTFSRKDIVVARGYDTQYGAGSNSGTIEIIPGTAAASPLEPALPNNAIKLATLTIPPNVITMQAGYIADQRTPSSQWARPRGMLASQALVTAQTGITTAVDLTGSSVTLTLPAGRRLRVGVSFGQVQATDAAPTIGIGYLMQDGVEIGRWFAHTFGAVGDRDSGSGWAPVLPSAGAHTYKAQLGRSGAGGTLHFEGSANRSFFYVEDVGGVIF